MPVWFWSSTRSRSRTSERDVGRRSGCSAMVLRISFFCPAESAGPRCRTAGGTATPSSGRSRSLSRCVKDAEIAAGNHHGIGEPDDVVDPVQRLRFLDLRNHGHKRTPLAAERRNRLAPIFLFPGPRRPHPELAQVILELTDIRGGSNKTQRYEIETMFHRKVQATAVIFGHRRNGQIRVRKIDSLVRFEHAAHHDFTDQRLAPLHRALFNRSQLHRSIIEQNSMSGPRLPDEPVKPDFQWNGSSQGHLGRNRVEGFRDERHLGSLRQRSPFIRLVTHANLGATQIAQHADVFIELQSGLPHPPEALQMLRESAMGEIDSENANPFPDETRDHLRRMAGRAKGCNDLGQGEFVWRIHWFDVWV